MKTISERILDALRKLGPCSFDELLMETVRQYAGQRDATLPELEKALDGLRERGLIALDVSHFKLTVKGSKYESR